MKIAAGGSGGAYPMFSNRIKKRYIEVMLLFIVVEYFCC